MNENLVPFIIFLILAPLFWLYFQRQKKQRVSNFSENSADLGLEFETDPAFNQRKLSEMPPFRLFASGTNQTIGGTAVGKRAGITYELFDYHSGDQSGNGSTDVFVFSARVNRSGPQFSLVHRDLLAKWRDNSNRQQLSLDAYPQLKQYDLHLIGDTGRAAQPGIDPAFLDQFIQFCEERRWPKAELLNDRFIYYVNNRGRMSAADMERVITEGCALAQTLSR